MPPATSATGSYPPGRPKGPFGRPVPGATGMNWMLNGPAAPPRFTPIKPDVADGKTRSPGPRFRGTPRKGRGRLKTEPALTNVTKLPVTTGGVPGEGPGLREKLLPSGGTMVRSPVLAE